MRWRAVQARWRAVQALALRFHPDKCTELSNSDATARFQAISHAYKVAPPLRLLAVRVARIRELSSCVSQVLQARLEGAAAYDDDDDDDEDEDDARGGSDDNDGAEGPEEDFSEEDLASMKSMFDFIFMQSGSGLGGDGYRGDGTPEIRDSRGTHMPAH